MKITNQYGAPEVFWRAAAKQRAFTPGRISVTELLRPPQMRALLRQFDTEMETDCADNTDAFFGTAVHEYLAQFAERHAHAEERFEYEDQESGFTVHGTPDYAADGELIDWKTTRVRALQYDRKEWEQQVNLYRFLLEYNGIRVRELTVWAFLRDYDPQKRGEDGYPSHALVKIPMPMWDADETFIFLRRRIGLHAAAEAGVYGSCTPEERWQRDTWAVMSVGKDRARAVFRDAETAEEYRNAAGAIGLEVVQRVGEPVRCQGWCPVSSKCAQWQAERPNTLLEDLEDSVRLLVARA